MKIGIVIGRIGGEDGVALETEKWIEILQRLGHEVVILTGALEGTLNTPTTLLPLLAFDHPDVVEEQGAAFFGATPPPGFCAKIKLGAEHIRDGILRWIEAERIERLLIENASALPCHLQMGWGVQMAVAASSCPTITHDHDFAWERGARYETPLPCVREIITAAFPLDLPCVRHAVINLNARAVLGAHGIESVVAPNVMDFAQPYAQLDDYNADLRASLGLAEEDILLFQITRIVRRKGIETAIELVDQLKDPRVKLVITGNATDDDPGAPYLSELKALTARLGLQAQVLFAGARFDNQRGRLASGEKVYSLSDAYAHADACAYFSTYEGFGNAFVEAVLARRPIFVNRYEPVYWPDIGSKGFEAVMIEGGRLTPEAVAEMKAILMSPPRRAAIAARNFEIGRRAFSYEALTPTLAGLFS